jgi:2,3-bisphosphoglycerate-independent phosphoglycerate mutase
MAKKILYVVLDGMGDRPIPALGNQTPLEAARTPGLDSLAAKGICGTMYPVGRGISPESDIAVISILGYDPHRYYTGRGPLEAHAVGVEVRDGDVAFRANFSTVGENLEIVDRRAGRNLTTEEATELSREITEKVRLTSYPATFVFKNTVEHRAVLVLRSQDRPLSGQVSNTDPAYGREGLLGVALKTFEKKVQKCAPLEDATDPEGARIAAALTNEFTEKSHKVLNESPVNKKRVKEDKLAANIILNRDAGNGLPKFASMNERYGMNFGCIVEMPVERGIALLTGMHPIEVPVSQESLEERYGTVVQAVLDNLPKFDGIYVHIKGPDVPGHDGNYELKKEIIEKIDRFFVVPLLGKVDMAQTVFIVTADHSTPCLMKVHSDDPVPILVSGGHIQPDGVKKFSEKACVKGELGEMMGLDVMPTVVNRLRSE